MMDEMMHECITHIAFDIPDLQPMAGSGRFGRPDLPDLQDKVESPRHAQRSVIHRVPQRAEKCRLILDRSSLEVLGKVHGRFLARTFASNPHGGSGCRDIARSPARPAMTRLRAQFLPGFF